MKKLYPVLIFAALIFIVLWQLFFSNTNYYLVCVAVLIISMLPFFSSFERGEHTAKDITLIASLTALAVVSRAVFYLVPQVKPIAAVVGVSVSFAICLRYSSSREQSIVSVSATSCPCFLISLIEVNGSPSILPPIPPR